MQNKIVEALAMEPPIVTYAGIAAPLGLGEAERVVAVDGSEGMSETIAQLL